MSDVTPAVQRAGQVGPGAHGRAVVDPHVSHVWQYVAVNMLAAALDVEEMARVLHADDLTQGFASMDYDDMDPVAVEWYRSGARAVRAAILGGDS